MTRTLRLLLSLLVLAAAATSASFAADRPALAPGARYDPAIPTIKQVLGFDIGERITSPEEIATYLKALQTAAPDRTRLVEYARTWEGRPLHVLVVGSPEHIANLDALKRGLRQLAD